MRRRLLTVISAFSLLLCLAMATMWMRSYCVAEHWHTSPRLSGTSGKSAALHDSRGDRRPGIVDGTGEPMATTTETWTQWWVQSSNGRLQLIQQISGGARLGDFGYFQKAGYRRNFGVIPLRPGMLRQAGVSPADERGWSMPGIAYFQRLHHQSLAPPSGELTVPPDPLGPGVPVARNAPAAPPQTVLQGGRALTVSWPIPVCITMILPMIWLARSRHWRRLRLKEQGRCIHCGYDLRATRDRCPECGAIPENAEP